MEKSDSSELKKINNEIELLKKRLDRIESSVKTMSATKAAIQPERHSADNESIDIGISLENEKSVEFRVGEYGMAWLGNIVLLFGIAFLVQYLTNPLLSALVGFVAVAAIYSAAHFSQASFSYLSKLFTVNGHLLLFYVTLRLHFFETDPLIASKTTGLALLIVVSGILFYLAYRRQSATLTFLSLIMLLITGLIGNSLPVTAVITLFVSILAIVVYARYGWLKLAFAFVLLVYLFHSNWLLNNPIMGNQLTLPESPGLKYLAFLLTAIIFSLIAILPQKEKISDEFLISAIIWNGIGFSIVLLFSTLLYYKDSYVLLFLSISAVCLFYSILLQSKSAVKIIPAMYALYSFLAMSVAFYGIFLLPKAYTLLALQSMLVVSMALWFRSRFIVVMNTILFLVLLVLYLSDEANYSGTNFSFMVVAFVTARVINWKKERLNLKTELIRNVYLLAGFMMTLVAFYHAFPESLITASWILAAILFFVTSLVLKNVKYRWLAIASMVASAIKLIFSDMANIDIGYRVLLFLVFAIISITASILYTKFYKQKKE
ncbi:hypothetical protein [Mangrovibacterium lignilyticum]|uniref:hypothetical protein n=1 Tax=Mangrovibacterium lignilyticum TaxID=2668052 RepID=UPI0013D88754|nr:hypothetical protein [Mangrovibacterium lignilyticum]